MKTLINDLKHYTNKTQKIYLPLLWEKWSVEPEKLTSALVHLWNSFPNPRMEGTLLNLKAQDPVWYEVCDTKYRRGKVIHRKDLQDHFLDNQKNDQHVSVYAHDDKWVQNFEETNSVTCKDTTVGVDTIYIELDRETIHKAILDAMTIYFKFPYKEAMRFWFSGNKSIHIEIDAALWGSPIDKQKNICGIGKLIYNIAHDVAGDCRYGNGFVDVWNAPKSELFQKYWEQFKEIPKEDNLQYIRQRLENLDPNLYRVNSLIRSPWSIHEKGERQKVHLELWELNEKSFHKISPKKLDSFRNYPYLIHTYFDLYEDARPKREYNYSPNVTDDIIIQTFKEFIPEFDVNDANASGFCGDYYSPFYEDTNPSVAVNINNGYYVDLGMPDHSFDFYELYAMCHKITREQAIRRLNDTT